MSLPTVGASHEDLRQLLADLERAMEPPPAPLLTLADVCAWAGERGYVLTRRETVLAFAKAARVEVQFDDMAGVLVVGAAKNEDNAKETA